MKNKYITIYALILLSLVVTAVFLLFTPEKVPMHYNDVGEIDRLGSKYENLLFPVVTALTGMFFVGMAKYQSKKKECGNEKVLVISGIAVLIFFNLMFAYFLYKATIYSPDAAVAFDIIGSNKLISIGLGALLCVLGNIMPKARLNSLVGLRTVWSMRNDRVWQKSQRFGGISMVLCGIVVIIASLFIAGIASIFVTLGLLMIDVIISVVVSYIIYKNDLKESNSR